jgi:hypothetical protein
VAPDREETRTTEAVARATGIAMQEILAPLGLIEGELTDAAKKDS